MNCKETCDEFNCAAVEGKERRTRGCVQVEIGIDFSEDSPTATSTRFVRNNIYIIVLTIAAVHCETIRNSVKPQSAMQ